jgi:hypothetical protein
MKIQPFAKIHCDVDRMSIFCTYDDVNDETTCCHALPCERPNRVGESLRVPTRTVRSRPRQREPRNGDGEAIYVGIGKSMLVRIIYESHCPRFKVAFLAILTRISGDFTISHTSNINLTQPPPCSLKKVRRPRDIARLAEVWEMRKC